MNGPGAGHQSGTHPRGQASLQLLCPSDLTPFVVSSLPPGPTIPAKPLPNTTFKLASLYPKHETRSLLLREALRASEPFGRVCAYIVTWAQPHGRACDYLENERGNKHQRSGTARGSQGRTPPSWLPGSVTKPSHFRNLLASWQPCLVFVIVHCRKSNLPVFWLEVHLWKDALGCIQRGPVSWAGMRRGVATPGAGLGTKVSSVAASQGWGGHVSSPTRNVGSPAGL